MSRILVIDDEPEILELIRIILEGGGHQVQTCCTGRKAWDSIVEAKADLVVLDVMLPGVDGYSLQSQMFQDKRSQNTPVIILTALEPAKTLFDKSPNVIAFLAKPFRAEELMDKVRLALSAPAAA